MRPVILFQVLIDLFFSEVIHYKVKNKNDLQI